jgi:hypothetical protein
MTSKPEELPRLFFTSTTTQEQMPITKFKKVHTLPGKTVKEVYRVGNEFIRLTRSSRADVNLEIFQPFAEALKDDIAAQAAIDSLIDEIISANPRRVERYHQCRQGQTPKPGAIPKEHAAFFTNRTLYLSHYKANMARITERIRQKLDAAKERNDKQDN